MVIVPCTVRPRAILLDASEPLTGMFGANCGAGVAKKFDDVDARRSAVVIASWVMKRILFSVSQITFEAVRVAQADREFQIPDSRFQISNFRSQIISDF